MAKKIKAGVQAPIFKLESYNAGTINLEELIGSGKIVLIFSRYFGCPSCQVDLKTIVDNLHLIEEKGAKLLYITQSGPEVSEKIIPERGIKFPVIPSTKNELYKTYGLGKMTLGMMTALPGMMAKSKKLGFTHGEFEGSETQASGQFIIDDGGTIIHAKKGWLDLEAILSEI
ncbi:MAG: redoxin domain-containing protein [archaeon]|nr:redoxin domain-containing protein [archaeon]